MSKYSWMLVVVVGVSLMVASIGLAEGGKAAPAAATSTATAAPAAATCTATAAPAAATCTATAAPAAK